MHEAVADGQGAIGEFPLARRSHETMTRLELLQLFLDIRSIAAKRLRHDRRVELHAADSGRHQQLAIILGQPVDLELHHVADRGGNLLFDLGNRPVENPVPILQLHHLGITQKAKHVRKKERVAFGLAVNKLQQVRRKPMIGKAKGDQPLDFLPVQERQRNLTRRAIALPLDPHWHERVFGGVHLGGTIGGDQQNAEPGTPSAEV